MALEFVAGSSGSGKSHFIYTKLIEESLAAPNERFYVIVPEQFTMETQKALASLHPAHSLINIDILSFNRLAYRALEKTGRSRAPILEDTGKILVLQKIINEKKNDLKVMKGMLGKSGAASRLNSVISEMLQYRVDIDEINTSDKKISELLKCKLEDISLIRKSFFEYIGNKYLIMEEVPETLSKCLTDYEPMRGATVVFDGFTGFVPAQLLVIEKMLSICKKVTVTVTVDKTARLTASSSMSNLFYMSHQMTQKLIEAAKRTGCEVLPAEWTEHQNKSRFRNNKALLFLEKHLFRYDYVKFTEEQNSVFIGEAEKSLHEIEAAAEIISKYIRTGKYRYRDFAFVTGDIEYYGELAEEVFTKNGIPCFLDQKQGVLSDPAVEFVRAAVDMAYEDYSYKSVFRWLKTGMTTFSDEEVILFENYVLAAGIRGYSRYNKVWEKTYDTISQKELDVVNGIREKFLNNVSDFTSDFKERMGSVEKRTTALYRLISDNDIQQKCKNAEEEFTYRGELSKAGEYSQIYKIIMDILQKTVEIMGEEKVSLELYKNLLDAAFEDIKLGLIPPKQDQVLIGDIERSRLGNIKVMFFAGINEGVIPKAGDNVNLLSQNDRDALSKMDIKLAPDAREKMYRQRLYLYLNLTKPSEKLYLSYSREASSGEAALPSYLINVIRSMFPKVQIEDISGRDVYSRLETSSGRNSVVVNGYEYIRDEEPDDSFLEIVSRYQNNSETQNLIEKLNAAVWEKCPDTFIGEKAAEILYGKDTPYSASRMEMFGKCRFKHFLKYALSLKEREIYEFTAADIGNILHEAISIFGKEMKRLEWPDITDEKRDEMADAALIKAYENKFKGNENRRAFDIARLGKINRTTAWIISQQAKRGEFLPEEFEAGFMLEGIKGIIDRIDVCSLNGEEYVRVVDYKSSGRRVDLNEFYHGTQVQLPLYMTAACESIKNKNSKARVNPAGIYYLEMSAPLIKVDSVFDEVKPENIMSEIKLSGITLDSPEIIRMMDKNLVPGKASDIINVKPNKKKDAEGNDTFDTRSSRLMSMDDFYQLSLYTRYLIKKARQQIEGGCADIDPKQIGGTDSCSYCPYSGICRFDERIPGYTKKKIDSLKDDEILEKIAKELEAERKKNGI